MAAPTRTPNHLRVIAGTFRADREAPQGLDLPALDEIPPAPDWLNAAAAAEWCRLAGILSALGLLNELCLAPLAHLCATHAKLTRTWSAGEAPSGHLLAQYRALVNDFGLTPVASLRLPQKRARKKENPFCRDR